MPDFKNQKNQSQKKKILIFYAKAGGGHESAAKAIKQAVEFRNLGEVKIVDVFSTSSNFTQWMFNDAYTLAVTKYAWLWFLVCNIWSFKPFFRLNFWVAKNTSKATNCITQELDLFKPDIVLTTYLSLDFWIHQTLKKQNLNLPVFSLLADIFSPHQSWFLQTNNPQNNPQKYSQNNTQNSQKKDPKNLIKNITKYCVFSEKAKQVAIKNGVYQGSLKVFHPFFNEEFLKPVLPKIQQNLQKELNLNPQIPTILISGGGPGIPQTIQIIKQFFAQKANINLIIICGRNQNLKNEVEKYLSTQNLTNQTHKINTCVTGFTNQMPEFVSISDLVIAKAGPATVFELLAMQKPFILAHYIWPQEKGNVDFVTKNGYGIYQKNPVKIVKEIQKFFPDSFPNSLQTPSSNLPSNQIKNPQNSSQNSSQNSTTNPDLFSKSSPKPFPKSVDYHNLQKAVLKAKVKSGMNDLVDYILA